MLERICPACQAGNQIDERRCRACGASLAEQLPARVQPAPLALRGRALPPALRQAARPIALGLAALALEVGATLLERRRAGGQLAEPGAGRPAPPRPASRLVIRQRVWEEYEQGQLRRRVVENLLDRSED